MSERSEGSIAIVVYSLLSAAFVALARRRRSLPELNVAGLLSQLLPQQLVTGQTYGLDLAILDGFEHGTIRFLAMGAVTKPACGSKRDNVSEDLVERNVSCPQTNRSNTGGIDHHSPAGKFDQLAGRGGVAPAPVTAADL